MTKNRSSQSGRLCEREGKKFLVCSRMWEYNKSNILHKFKNCNRTIGKADESLRRKATGPVKWQPVT